MKKSCAIFGFTLVELLVALGLLSIVMLGAIYLFSNAMKLYRNDDTQWQIQQEARHALQQITRDLRTSKMKPDSIDQADPSILTLEDLSVNDRVITFKCEIKDGNNSLYRIVSKKTGSGTAVLAKNKIIDNVKKIAFSFGNTDNVLNIELTTKKPGFTNEYTITTKLYTRINT